MLTIILGLILGILIYFKLIKPTKFWTDKGLTYEPSAWPLFGNMKDAAFKKKHMAEITLDLYKKYPNDRYVGYLQFTMPALLIRDIELIKQIGVKEFDHFHDHMSSSDADHDPLLNKSLINLQGDKWKQMRATLSPAFTSSKMRNIYQLMVECSENFIRHLRNEGKVDVEIKDLFSRFASNVIASTAFGIQEDSLENPENNFLKMAKRLSDLSFGKMLKMFAFQLFPKLFKIFKIRLLDREIADFFTTIITDNINKRREENIIRPDMIHLLMEAQKGKLRHDQEEEGSEGFATVEESHIGRNSDQMELTNEHIVAQALLFFFAGLETVSNAASVMAYELATNPEVQKKLQEEIDTVKSQHLENIPYEALLSMKYLDQVVCESLRILPPAFQTSRYCNKDFTINPKRPTERTFVVEEGVHAVIPVMALHHDSQYFPDPEKFQPERFSAENRSKILPGSYLPFGIGPRNCIGSRFALLELKTLFFYLLSNFNIKPNDKTEIPFKLSPKKANLSPENGFQLTLEPRLTV